MNRFKMLQDTQSDGGGGDYDDDDDDDAKLFQNI